MADDNTASNPRERNQIWSSLSQALGAELRESRSIHGVSGLEHPVQAIAVDDKNGRVIVFSAEPNPRVAALMQVDVQATMPDTKVLVARPVVFDLGVISRQLFKTVDDARLNLNDFAKTMQRLEKANVSKRGKARTQRQLETLMAPAAHVFENVALPALSQIVDVLQQFSHLDWPNILSSLQTDPQNPEISFAALMEIDNLAIDRQHGVCPLPLYEFKEADWELMSSGTRIEDVQERLKQLDIYQYFYPSPDQIVLGSVEHGITERNDIVTTVKKAPELGHPLGDSELVPNMTNIPEIIEALAERGYIAEGEHALTITPKGTTTRSSIKFRPRESLLVKLLNRFSVKVDATINSKDFFKP